MMARMEMDYQMDFLKLFRMNVFQIIYSSLMAWKSLKFCKSVVAIRNSFRKLLSII